MTDWATQQAHLSEAITIASNELTRPSVLYRPRVFLHGEYWICLLGLSMQEGVYAAGRTPREAVDNFDYYAWLGKPVP